MYPSIFSADQWQIMIYWYLTLTSVCGGLLLFGIVKSGYKYSQSALNPGIRASFIEDVQRAVLAMGIVALAPTIITLILGINDAFVGLCGNVLTKFVTAPELEQVSSIGEASIFENIVAGLFQSIIYIFNALFGLDGIDKLVFNGNTNVFNSISGANVSTGNVMADVVVNFGLFGFNIYFNAVYMIRFWMLTAAIAVAPLVTWIWAMTGSRAVLEVFIAEIIQSVFMQSGHALSLSIFMSIANGTVLAGSASSEAGATASGLVQIGVFVAGFGGSICVAVLVVMGFRLIVASGEKERAEAREGVRKALIGLIILGLCTIIAGFIAASLSGSWGVRYN